MRRGRVRAGGRAAAGTAVLVLAALAAACGGSGGQGTDPAEGSPAGEAASATAARTGQGGGDGRVVNVEVATLSAEPFTETIRITGVAEANRDVTLSAEESGRIRELPVEKGTPVSDGDVVARIDDAILAAEVGQARAQAELARERFERQEQLFRQEKAISEITYLEARYGAEQAAERLASLEERLARTRVRVPFDGVMDDRLVELGSMVSPGTPVARLVDLDPIRVSGGVPERFAPDVEVGTEATVRFDVLPDTTFTARLAYVGATVDRDSRTFPVEFTVRNPGRIVKPEMVANIEIVRRRLA
ncbi:MAG: efflux RND transporter periplasmic adaptor subunit, partial [Candidatus Palauibacterales bacterium]|nr:efflux RND transporter periplasmic adaptor subunit [Candidatus Palauibacterales bacterium]